MINAATAAFADIPGGQDEAGAHVEDDSHDRDGDLGWLTKLVLDTLCSVRTFWVLWFFSPN